MVQGSWCSPFLSPAGKNIRLAGIVSNPPYIPKQDLEGLQAEVKQHEPALALDGGAGDGLDHLRSIFAGAKESLLPNGFIAVETNGDDQCEDLKSLLNASSDWHSVQIHKDLCGVTRFVSAFRSSNVT